MRNRQAVGSSFEIFIRLLQRVAQTSFGEVHHDWLFFPVAQAEIDFAPVWRNLEILPQFVTHIDRGRNLHDVGLAFLVNQADSWVAGGEGQPRAAGFEVVYYVFGDWQIRATSLALTAPGPD